MTDERLKRAIRTALKKHPGVDWRRVMADASIPLTIVGSEPAAAALCERGIAAIAIPHEERPKTMRGGIIVIARDQAEKFFSEGLPYPDGDPENAANIKRTVRSWYDHPTKNPYLVMYLPPPPLADAAPDPDALDCRVEGATDLEDLRETLDEFHGVIETFRGPVEPGDRFRLAYIDLTGRDSAAGRVIREHIRANFPGGDGGR